jgi:hypothetical protein
MRFKTMRFKSMLNPLAGMMAGIGLRKNCKELKGYTKRLLNDSAS